MKTQTSTPHFSPHHKGPFLALLAAATFLLPSAGGQGFGSAPSPTVIHTMPATCPQVGKLYALDSVTPPQLYICTLVGSTKVLQATNGDPINFTGQRSLGGCPVWPDSSIFRADLTQAPRDDVSTIYTLAASYVVTNATWSGGTATLTLAGGTAGLTTGMRVFTTRISPAGFNTGFGTTHTATDVSVPITAITSTTISFALASDPGAFVSGGTASTGFGGLRLNPDVAFSLNYVTNDDPTVMLVGYSPNLTQPFVPLSNTNLLGSDYYPVAMANGFSMEGSNLDGTAHTIATGPWAPTIDGHVLILNTDTCQEIDVYGVNGPGPPFHVYGMAAFNLKSNAMRTARLSTTDTTGLTSSDAAGLPVYPLVLTHSQLYASEAIEGTIRVIVPNSYPAFVWPGTHYASHNDTPILPPMGSIWKLRSDYDITTCAHADMAGQTTPSAAAGLTPNFRKLLSALKKHGVIVADNGGQFYMSLSADFTSAELDETALWFHCLQGSDFEVVNSNALQIDGRSFAAKSDFAPDTRQPLQQIAIQSVPTGLLVTIDNSTCTTPCQLGWDKGSTHIIGALAQSAGTGSRYAFASWSDSGASSHTVTATGPLTFTVTYGTQYLLTTAAGGNGTGTITPSSDWYDSGAVVAVTATATGGSSFQGFFGGLTGLTNPQNITMSSAKTVTGAFYLATAWGPSYTAWSSRKPITINPASGGATLTNFPVLVSLATDSDIAAAALSSGNDILFTTSDGATKLDHEIEKYTTATGELVAWVRIPSFSAVAPTQLYVYYGNAAASNQQNAVGVWDANHKTVVHAKETAAATSISDATGNLTLTSARNASVMTVAGKIGNALKFNGTSDVISAASFSSGDTYTISAWVKVASNTNIEGLVAFTNSSAARRELWKAANHGPNAVWGSGATVSQSGNATAVDDNTWHFLTATSAAAAPTLYIDGVAVTATAGSALGTLAANVLRIGAIWTGSANSTFTTAALDEVRLSNTVRSAGWISTSYANQSSPSTFHTLYAQEH